MAQKSGPADSAGSPASSPHAVSMPEHQRRQLAAVMFADIVGYTALMQENEQLGIETRTKYQKVLQAQHDGGALPAQSMRYLRA